MIFDKDVVNFLTKVNGSTPAGNNIWNFFLKKRDLLFDALSSSWLSIEAGETESAWRSVFEFSSILPDPRWDIGGDEDGEPGEPWKWRF